MAKAKRYTAEQLSDAEKMAATLANVPEEKRTLVIMMTNSFMAGMEAQKAIDDTAKAGQPLRASGKSSQHGTPDVRPRGSKRGTEIRIGGNYDIR